MKNLKKLLLILLVLTLTLGAFACKEDKIDGNETDSDTAVAVEPISFLDYAVVRPERTSEALLDDLSVLYMKLTNSVL